MKACSIITKKLSYFRLPPLNGRTMRTGYESQDSQETYRIGQRLRRQRKGEWQRCDKHRHKALQP